MNMLTECETFRDLVSAPDEAIDLAGAALLFARDEYPDLDVAAYRSMLQRMSDEARPRVARVIGNPFAAIDALNTYLFSEQGFRGNHAEYFDPRNSFLNEVLDRRRGIPITLSLVYMEVAAGAGFPVQGVGFPGHFLVRHASGDRELLIDPFHGGEILLAEDCRKRLALAYGDQVPLEARFFKTAGKRAILTRMLQNLLHVYAQAQDHERVLRVVERLGDLAPGSPHHLRDRSAAHAGLGHYARALSDLERYLLVAPGASDAAEVRGQIKSLRRLTASLN
ncbi:MAG TPA: tetratricopeptide repeat protein [Patescibacteria group bacterium]|nr:tetratricopeptide repeat protein [Patescibacteria group bacterium]